MSKSYSSKDVKFYGGGFKTRSANQAALVETIETNFITFSVGAAGSGKSFLSIAVALDLLAKKEIKRIVITRPAVEAGEQLGFLPGTLEDKINPYLYPLYDAFDDLIGKERRDSLIEKGQVEILPIAYMRGRTLNDAIVILDEAQNTTISQMKMFLTRLGKHSKAIVNGDISQNDLKPWQKSGLEDAIRRLEKVKGIGVVKFGVEDVVRHKIVQAVIEAYQE